MKKRTNPIARSLRSPMLRQKVIANKKAYKRKGKHKASPSSLVL